LFFPLKSVTINTGFKSWQLRWFVLKEEKLFYYKEQLPKDTIGREHPPCGVIYLEEVLSIENVPNTKEFIFQIKSQDRVYELGNQIKKQKRKTKSSFLITNFRFLLLWFLSSEAESEDDRKDWVIGLNQVKKQIDERKRWEMQQGIEAPWFHQRPQDLKVQIQTFSFFFFIFSFCFLPFFAEAFTREEKDFSSQRDRLEAGKRCTWWCREE
jgi:hypothetical protein